MKAKKVVVNIVKQIIERSKIEYQCPKCKTYVTDYTIDTAKITRFLCSCGQEIIADYRARRSGQDVNE